jgi:dolichol-phosphate mannosyltransferase
MTIFLLIPFLNEAGNFKKLSDDIKYFFLKNRLSYKVFLVNDGSTDKSVSEIQKYFINMPFEIISHEKNLGPGAAFQTGFLKVLEEADNQDLVLTLEADNTSNLSIVPQMLHRMEEGYDVILASPYTYGGTILNTALHRRILSFFANLFLREILGLRGILTISSFFRLYKVSVLRGIQNRFEGKLIERQGFEGKVELLMKFVFQRTPISEVPLVLDTSNRVGRSKIKIIKTTLSLLALYFEKDRWRYDPSTL